MSKILVVEDEESFRDALAFVLSKEGFEVKLVNDGQAAVETFEKELGTKLGGFTFPLPSSETYYSTRRYWYFQSRNALR